MKNFFPAHVSVFVAVFAFACFAGKSVVVTDSQLDGDKFIFTEDCLDETADKWIYVSSSNLVEDTLSLFGIGNEYMFQYGQSKTNDSPVFSLWASNSQNGVPGIFAIQKGQMSFFALVTDSNFPTSSLVATSWCMNSESSWGVENTCFGPCKLFASRQGTPCSIFETLRARGMGISFACLGDATNLVLRNQQGLEYHNHDETRELKQASISEIESCLKSMITPTVYFQNAPLLVILDQFVSCSQSGQLVFGAPKLDVDSADWTISIPCYFAKGPHTFSPLVFSRCDYIEAILPSVSFTKSEDSFMSFFETLAVKADCIFSISSGTITFSGKKVSF